MRDGAASDNSVPPWDSSMQSTSPYVQGFDLDGMAHMVAHAVQFGAIADAIILIESTKGTGRFTVHGIDGYVLPHISEAARFINDGDILFFRGGFKGWLPFIDSIKKKGKNWLLFYGANTGNGRWPFWDVVLDDLSDELQIINGKLLFPFTKPIPPNFHFKDSRDRQFDICIGASHIHDRKGQWRIVDAVAAAKNYYNKDLLCIMPGALHGGSETNRITNVIRENNLSISIPGMVGRKELIRIYSESKVFAKGGAHGQNDRGLLESLLCGCIPMLTDNNRHPKWVSWAFSDCIISNRSSNKDMAKVLIELTDMWDSVESETVAGIAKDENGFSVACDEFESLLSVLSAPHNMGMKYLQEVYNVSRS